MAASSNYNSTIHKPHHATNTFASYWVLIYTSGWRAAMWIKCLAEGQKVPGIDGNRTRNPLIQSQGFNPVYHGTFRFFELTSPPPSQILDQSTTEIMIITCSGNCIINTTSSRYYSIIGDVSTFNRFHNRS